MGRSFYFKGGMILCKSDYTSALSNNDNSVSVKRFEHPKKMKPRKPLAHCYENALNRRVTSTCDRDKNTASRSNRPEESLDSFELPSSKKLYVANSECS
ncbi:hypothetical protein KGM_214274 [Danaus plexippus plexippus]|uniref:Uncharacterized protein n=1 Tax=Danaus plexippus plexippus TaxID=278856 RepID=A0A212FDS0_DANPL|nr:hypothetical protein KGM_214274 [Danaus plexippus plexippus]